MAKRSLTSLDMGGQQINNAADPTLPSDLATKNYQDVTLDTLLQKIIAISELLRDNDFDLPDILLEDL